MFTKIAIILTLMASLNGTPIEDHSVYMRGMEVTAINHNEDIVTCVDAEGFEWEFYGCEDYLISDLVSCLMDTNGTEDTILDDIILMTDYTGYWME